MKPTTRKIIIGSCILIALSLVTYVIERIMWQKALQKPAHVTWNAYQINEKGDTIRKSGSAETGAPGKR